MQLQAVYFQASFHPILPGDKKACGRDFAYSPCLQ
jgi:hypothetical protein